MKKKKSRKNPLDEKYEMRNMKKNKNQKKYTI